jgi:hypothetical protein
MKIRQIIEIEFDTTDDVVRACQPFILPSECKHRNVSYYENSSFCYDCKCYLTLPGDIGHPFKNKK